MNSYELSMLTISILTLLIGILAFILSVIKIITDLILELIKNKK